ncbi:hypothetical protein Pelo_16767 [Pelomyxa schiedti]|nr:hypothetical protein Pelo_16767 [Pelomyxa schiedti]
MATWRVADATGTADIEATITTRSQLGGLAAGATIERCGGASAMQRVMGLGPATSFVRALWRDLVRPTIRFFVVQVYAYDRGASTRCRFPSVFSVCFSLSPLLLSVSSAPGPALLPICFTRWVDATRIALDSKAHEGRFVLAIKNTGTGSEVTCVRGPPSSAAEHGHEFSVNAKWAAVVRYDRRGESTEHPTLTVAGIKKKEGEATTAAAAAGGQKCVVVEMPVVDCCECPYCARQVQMFADQHAESQVVVTHSRKDGSVTSIFVVDLEETYDSGSLALVSTTTCVLPTSFESLIVLRNPRSGSSHNQRTFIVRTCKSKWTFGVWHVEEGTGIATHIMDGAVDIFRVSDALFCVSVRTNRLHEWFQIRHCDRPTKSENYLEGLNHSKENKGKHMRRFLAESGFIFNVFANNVSVIEPTTGLFVLTMRFARSVGIMGSSLLELMYRICCGDPEISVAPQPGNSELWGSPVVTLCVGVYARPLSSTTGTGAVPTDVIRIDVSAPLLGVISVRMLDHRKSLVFPDTEERGLSPSAARLRQNCECERWDLVGPNGECVIKKPNTNGTTVGTFYFLPAPPFIIVDSDYNQSNNSPDEDGFDGPMFLFEESYSTSCAGCHTGNTKWWAWCDGEDLCLLEIAERIAMRNGNELKQTSISTEETKSLWSILLAIPQIHVDEDDDHWVVQLFVSEVNPNELVIAAVARSTLFLVIDVTHTLKTGNLTVVSRTTCAITSTSDGRDYVSAIMCRQKSGQRVFVVRAHGCTRAFSDVHQVDETTGVKKLVTNGVMQLCHLTPSLFCTSHHSPPQCMSCHIWDCNDTTRPVLVVGPVEGCTHVESACGLLLFNSNTQIRVVDALTGVELATFDVPSSFSLMLKP